MSEGLEDVLDDGDVKVAGAVIEPDGSVEELSPEEAKKLLEIAAAAEEEKRRRLRDLARRLGEKRDEVVRAKESIEARWIDDVRQYEGETRLADTKGVKGGKSGGSPPSIHVTRARTDLWEARIGDMLLPSQDSAWSLEVDPADRKQSETTPVAPAQPPQGHLMQQVGGMPPMELQEPVAAPETLTEAEQACQNMKDTISSQLEDCGFEKAMRRAIRDACRIGAGLLMGPMTGLSRKRRFSEGGGEFEIVESTSPEIREGDPWCFYPDMVDSADKAEFAFYVHLMSRREVFELADYPDFDEGEIEALLKKDPELGVFGKSVQRRNNSLTNIEPTTGRYAVWRYTGVLEKDDLKLLCLCEEDEPVGIQMVDLWFCQDHVLKASLAPITRDFRIPYYVFSPFPADDTMFGYGLPYLCRDSARFADAAYRIALHNLSMSSGPLVLARKGAIKPADGRYDLRGPKWLWIDDAKGGDRPLNDLFDFRITPNVAEQAFAGLDRAMAIVDMELNAEGWASMDGAEESQTASGLAMIMNTKSIIQRRAAACADDDVFKPLIERMYWWNMDYNDDPAIRGNFVVTTQGQSLLLVKDVQVQHATAFLQMAYGNPKFEPYINDYDALVSVAKLFDMPDINRLIKPKKQADQEMQKAKQDPNQELTQAQVELTQMKTRVLELESQIKAQKEQRLAMEAREDADFQQASRQLDHEEDEMNFKARMTEADVRMEVAKLRAQVEMLDAMEKTNLSKQQLEARMAQAQASVDSKERIKGVDAGMKAQEMALKERFGTGI